MPKTHAHKQLIAIYGLFSLTIPYEQLVTHPSPNKLNYTVHKQTKTRTEDLRHAEASQQKIKM
jgi:hypothetical protein